MRILLVEDDPIIGDGLQRVLTHAGFLVDWVAEGILAEAALVGITFAAVVLDWQLPNYDGIRLVQLLRAQGNLIPILMLTARDSAADRALALSQGVSDYLVKPVSSVLLVQHLNAVIYPHYSQSLRSFSCGALSLNRLDGVIKLDGKEISTSPACFDLLALMIQQPILVFTEYQLSDHLQSCGHKVPLEDVLQEASLLLGGVYFRHLRGIGYTLVCSVG